MARTSPSAAFQSKGQKPLENIDQRVQTFEILSRRQKFARASRRIGAMAMAGAALIALAYFSPILIRFAQSFSGKGTEATASTNTPASPTEPQLRQAASTPTPTPPLTRQPGDVIRDCASCPEMIVLPGGLFLMGSPATEAGRARDEGPQREVSIAPFAIGKYEITFAQWDACLAGGGCNGFSPPDRGWGRGNRPVTGVSWEDAQAYLDWLNTQAGGLRYRLASEAEWEYAARAGQTGAYTYGPRVTATQATFRARQTTPVGEHEANAFTLFDMHGNVGEWVEDCYAPTYELAPIDGAAVQSDECGRRVYRGGGYTDQATVLRAAARRAAAPALRQPSVGFRVVRTLD
jgi:formylglycine-generating enzyme required for sulfatase activity